ncbi:GNAT family N-acetyltransferase [Chloroflexota bacterium]
MSFPEADSTGEETMDTHIERVRQFDKNTLGHLFKRAGEEDADLNPDFFEDEKNILLVSHTEDKLSGFLWAHVLQNPGNQYPKMFLYSIDVFDEFRRQGIASQLIEELKNIAQTYNCREMFLLTGKSNQAAMGLYRKTRGKVKNDAVFFIYDKDALEKLE